MSDSACHKGRLQLQPQNKECTEFDCDGSGHAISSAHLLKGARSVEIEHHGAIYRLQETRQGKLILTK